MTAAWLNNSYLQQVLRVYYQSDEVQVKSVNLESALGRGENYGAILTRIRVVHKRGDNQMEYVDFIMAKTELENEDFDTRERKAPYDIFNRELDIYDHVMPRLQELANEQLCPKIYHIDRPHRALLMEDLSMKGYKMASRLNRLDEQHVRLVLNKLAKMQAASVIMQAETQSLNRFDRGFFNQYTESFQTYFVGCLRACAEYLRSQPGYEQSAILLEQLAPHYMSLGLRCFRPEEDQLNVFTHGDLWTNNMMFKYENNEPIDVLLIDFQYAFWGSPTLDIHHLINTSATECVRSGKQMKMRCLYYETFREQLKRLKFKGKWSPSLKKFHLASEQKRFYAVHCGLILQPVLLNTDETDADFAALLSDKPRGINMKRRLYLNEAIQDSVKMLVKQFELEGLLEPEQYV
ncbi:uncharacterized protein [Drosophila tropicalis]|uniref:uncharacterized protein n=1 Tax=Drosophila tropicalis TaxID=46794 RepID=UPI0035AC281F